MRGRLQIISGKGGVGKSVVAAAIAQRHAARGARTLLVQYDQINQVHPVYPLTVAYRPANVLPGLDVCSLDAHLSLKEYVRRKMTFSFAYLPILENPAVVRFLDALPLFSELMALGKLYDLAGKESPYEQVVFDAPATGHAKILLQVPEVAIRTLIAGPIYDNARKILKMLRDPELSELVIVTLPEETPVREARDLVQFAREQDRLNCRRIYINRFRAPRFSDTERNQLDNWRRASADADAVVQVADYDTRIAESHAQQSAALAALELECTFLPELPPAAPAAIVASMQQAIT